MCESNALSQDLRHVPAAAKPHLRSLAVALQLHGRTRLLHLLSRPYYFRRCCYVSLPSEPYVYPPSRSPNTVVAMSMSNSESFVEPDSPDDIDSLPSSATSSEADEEEYMSDADREWKESLQQLELLLTMVMVPYLGKYFGRKAAYWGTSSSISTRTDALQVANEFLGWAKFMEWKYPVEVVFSSPKTFKLAGAIEAAATL